MNPTQSTEQDRGGRHLFESEVAKRLRRIESRVVRGFELMGVRLTDHAAGIEVDHVEKKITITSLGTTMNDLAASIGGKSGTYDVVYRDKVKCRVSVH